MPWGPSADMATTCCEAHGTLKNHVEERLTGNLKCGYYCDATMRLGNKSTLLLYTRFVFRVYLASTIVCEVSPGVPTTEIFTVLLLIC